MRTILLIVALSLPAAAYLDPVTGNIIVQAVLAGVAALAVAYGSIKARLQSLFGKKVSTEESNEGKTKEVAASESDEGSSDKMEESESK